MRKHCLLAGLALLCLSLLGTGCASQKTAGRNVANDDQERLMREKLDKAAAELNAMIYFDFDSAVLKPEARKVLLRKAELMKTYPQMKLAIEGHSDERGTAEYNHGLGERRARAAADFLVKQGVAPARLTAVSFGKDRPQDPGHNTSAWAKNRFDEFKASY